MNHSFIVNVLLFFPPKIANKAVDIIMKHQGVGESIVAREYYKQRYKVEVELYTYGGCFKSDFNTGGTVHVGRYCSIANNVHYFGANHPINSFTTSAYFYNSSFGLNVKDVERHCLCIGHDVWIGYGTIITSGCHYIGNGAIIGAGSIITHDVPPYSIVAGNPARIIRKRFSENNQLLLENSKWWKNSPLELMQLYDCIDDIEKFTGYLDEHHNLE